MAHALRMPAIAADSAQAAIQTWLVQPGEQVEVGQPVAEIETEKAVVDYESEHGGVFAGLLVAEGQSATVGQVIGVLAEASESVEEAMRAVRGEVVDLDRDAERAGAPAAPAPAPAPEQAAAQDHPSRRFMSPLVRRLAREKGIDLSRIDGSGPGGRIVRRDLDRYDASPHRDSAEPVVARVDGDAAAAKAHDEAPVAYTEVEHTPMRRLIARRLTESKQHVPHFYLRAECEVSALTELRRRINQSSPTPVTINDLVVKAAAGALRAVPAANAIWTETAVRVFSTVDIGIAVAVEGGLMTPVVRDVGSMPISVLAAATRDLTERARTGRLHQRELEGGTFAVTNLGMFGVQEFTAIINPPHAGILAVGTIARRPVVDGDDVRPADTMTVTLSVDHRTLDGATAAAWLSAFVELIEDPVRLLI
ncbi:dihydrolipoamide acetyltransferase family protein [Jiangella alba]|uniref:Dihydrolipoamide acetyltransferase component of pyruvate dehydrogenase complex n=1 Tax=Jiangella alba TaxID=561176 RepID=A0A1H5PY52_9ACTN|nr:dihydrolipoamide acetyltransferase family protein [Jiangella alba]SEF18736.1 pyruvate dehydrogenase E2 component (dihydrolipoamide acetyltransferase) [Jiangella alba]